MYSVMKMTCEATDRGGVSAVLRVYKEGKEKKHTYPCLTLLHIQPVLVELDNVGVFNLH